MDVVGCCWIQISSNEPIIRSLKNVTQKPENEGEEESGHRAVGVAAVEVEDEHQLREDDDVDEVAAEDAEIFLEAFQITTTGAKAKSRDIYSITIGAEILGRKLSQKFNPCSD